MKKTPLQQLIEVLESQHAAIPNTAYQKGIEYAIRVATIQLDEEKQMVVDAWVDGEGRFFDAGTEVIEAEKYFNNTFGQ